MKEFKKRDEKETLIKNKNAPVQKYSSKNQGPNSSTNHTYFPNKVKTNGFIRIFFLKFPFSPRLKTTEKKKKDPKTEVVIYVLLIYFV